MQQPRQCTLNINGNIIKEVRQATGLTQQAFAEHYNIPLNTLKNWECDIKNKNYRRCPVYTKEMIIRLTQIDFNIQFDFIER